nr:polysaccharide deacetylase family protein [Eubacterium sp.]
MITFSGGEDPGNYWDKHDTWGTMTEARENEDGTTTYIYPVNDETFSALKKATAVGFLIKATDYVGEYTGEEPYKPAEATVYGFSFSNTLEDEPEETVAPTETPEVETGDPVKVEDIDIDMSSLTSVFPSGPIAINFASQLPEKFDLKYFSSCKIDFECKIKDGEDASLMTGGKLALAKENDLSGYSDGLAFNYNLSATGTSATIDLAGKSGKAAGLNVQPFDDSYGWPSCLESVTIKGIKFIAKEDTFYPVGDEPTAAPTPTPIEATKFVYEGLDTSWIDSSKKLVAFTFDDGPVGTKEGSSSMTIQKILKENNVHATFFYIGSRISGEQGGMDEVKQAVANGFEIGNHGPDWNSVSTYETKEDLEEAVGVTNALLKEASGYSKFLFRAPNLSYSQVMYNYIDMPMINCAVDSKDWAKATTDEIIANVEAAQDGDVVLMHATEANTVEALPTLIKYFHDNGYEIVSVSELFAMKEKDLLTNHKYDSTRAAGVRQ